MNETVIELDGSVESLDKAFQLVVSLIGTGAEVRFSGSQEQLTTLALLIQSLADQPTQD